MISEWTTLFCGRELEAYQRIANNSALVVTFDYMGQISRPPNVHAASFFQREGFDQIHIASKKDIWYQTEEFVEVADIVAKARAGYAKVLAYGNSMGAYGALLISGRIDADIVIAFAPQYSVDPKLMPEEIRWIQVTGNIRFLYDDLAAHLSRRARIFAVFDPFCSVDMRHIRRLEAIRSLDCIKVPLTGHHPASFLKEVGLLDAVMVGMSKGTDVASELRHQIRVKRRFSPTYYMRLAQMLGMRHRLKDAIQAATVAYSLDPVSAGPLEPFFEILAFAPQYHAFADMAARLLEANFPHAAHYKAYHDSTWARLERYRGLS